MSGNSIERLLDKIDTDISEFLIFAGALDNNAKLISFRRGKASFSLPIDRQDTLDVQLSLMFSLIRQLEDISGPHKFTISRFGRHDIFLFGTSGAHVFVITSPTSEGRIARALAEMVSNLGDAEPVVATTSVASSNNDKTMTAAMTSPHHEESLEQQPQKFSVNKSRPETISILQGYLMALEASYLIQDDVGGFYKIKTDAGNKLAWSILEKLSSAFRDRIDIHHIGLDTDGKIFARVSLK